MMERIELLRLPLPTGGRALPWWKGNKSTSIKYHQDQFPILASSCQVDDDGNTVLFVLQPCNKWFVSFSRPTTCCLCVCKYTGNLVLYDTRLHAVSHLCCNITYSFVIDALWHTTPLTPQTHIVALWEYLLAQHFLWQKPLFSYSVAVVIRRRWFFILTYRWNCLELCVDFC